MEKKVSKKLKNNHERAARHQLIEELFYDFDKNHRRVYWINFVRGLFFGFGTILGGTVLVALIIWLLTQFAGWLPFIGQYIQRIVEAMQTAR